MNNARSNTELVVKGFTYYTDSKLYWLEVAVWGVQILGVGETKEAAIADLSAEMKVTLDSSEAGCVVNGDEIAWTIPSKEWVRDNVI